MHPVKMLMQLVLLVIYHQVHVLLYKKKRKLLIIVVVVVWTKLLQLSESIFLAVLFVVRNDWLIQKLS